MGVLLRLLSERMRMVREDAVAVSKVIEDAFQGRPEVDDEDLDKDLRQVFYDLQDERILDVRRIEVREDGQARRHYLWRVREDDVPAGDGSPAMPDPEARVYLRLGERYWERKPVEE